MSAFNPQYSVQLVSFRNMDHGSSYNTLHRGQKATPQQLTALREFMKEVEEELQCNGLL